MNKIVFNEKLIEKYDASGPRYTSYPTAANFHSEFLINRYVNSVAKSNEDLVPQGLSLYVHIPFCDTVCYYCACNKIVTKDKSKAVDYLRYLRREIELKGKMFDKDREVLQLHFGGGTPTFLNDTQITELVGAIAGNFTLINDATRDYAIEVDPRSVSAERIAALRSAGFNRLSFGVQDFHPRTQQAVNRIQPLQQVQQLVQAARDAGYKSVSMDLIYGLPFQTQASFAQTIEAVLELRPDRLSIFNYAHLPERFKPQRRINESDLPPAQEKLAIYQNTIQQLTEGGYVFIGMDHFSLPQDELAQAQQRRQLHRNFQGYTTHTDCNLVSFGTSAISYMDDCYTQNHYTTGEYYRELDSGNLPIAKGLCLTPDDQLRRYIIMELLCHFVLDIDRLEKKFELDFNSYFRSELSRLESMQDDGLLEISDKALVITPRGRLLARAICMVFDRYLGGSAMNSFSKVI